MRRPRQVRPYLMADGGNVDLVEVEGPVVRLQLQGSCGSCPSSTVTMTMGIKRRLMERIPEIVEVEALDPEHEGLDLTDENVDTVLGVYKMLERVGRGLVCGGVGLEECGG